MQLALYKGMVWIKLQSPICYTELGNYFVLKTFQRFLCFDFLSADCRQGERANLWVKVSAEQLRDI